VQDLAVIIGEPRVHNEDGLPPFDLARTQENCLKCRFDEEKGNASQGRDSKESLMAQRMSHLLVVAGALLSLGASYKTKNFRVEAPTPQVAKQIAKAAEKLRKELALEWLGEELPSWKEPCPVIVTLSMDYPAGSTSFSFAKRQVRSQKIEIRGPLDRLLVSALPHEIAHAIFAHRFGTPVARWADEGGAVLSEDKNQSERQERILRKVLESDKKLSISRLLAVRDYPMDVEAFYAQAYSLTRFLVEKNDKKKFVKFLAQGMEDGWEEAVRMHYGYETIEALEEAWLEFVRRP
jgi:hypothetical protein